MSTITKTITAKVAKWNGLCSHLNTSLFFADAFEPKPVYASAPVEMSFWYDVTNLCALFGDCMPYVYQASELYQNSRLRLNRNLTPTMSLLGIMENRGVISDAESKSIKNFVKAIKELRSCFCHNKPYVSFNPYKINQGLGTQSQQWGVFPHLNRSPRVPFDYNEATTILTKETQVMLDMLDNALNNFCLSADEDDIYNWSQSIAAWYLSSSDIINRCLVSYYRTQSPALKMGPQLFAWSSRLSFSSLTQIARALGKTVEDYIEGHLFDLTETIFNCHIVASPEQILPFFFDDIL